MAGGNALWIPDASGNWSDPTNWLVQVGVTGTYRQGQPGPDDAVSLTPGFSPGHPSAPRGTAPFTVNADITTTIGSLQGPAFAALNVAGATLTVGQVMALDGSVTIASGGLTLLNAGIPGYGPGTSTIRGALVDTGLLSVKGGSLQVLGGGSFQAGSIAIDIGATLNLADGAYTFSAGTYGFAGTLNSGGYVDLGAGDVTVTGAVTQTGGTIAGGGTLTLAGGYNPGLSSQGAMMAGPGTTILDGQSSTGQLYLNAGRVLENSGTLTIGKLYLGYSSSALNNVGPFGSSSVGATLQNDVGGVVYLQGIYSAGHSQIINNGAMIVASNGFGNVDVNAPLIDAGSLEVQKQALTLHGGGAIRSNGLSIANGALLTLASGVYALDAGTVSGSGTLALSQSGTTLSLGAANVTINDTFEQTYGTVSGSGILTLNGANLWPFSSLGIEMSGSGTTVLRGTTEIGRDGLSGALMLDGGRKLENQGSAIWASGSIQLGTGSTIRNDAGATFAIKGGNTISGPTNMSKFVNDGTIAKSGDLSISAILPSLVSTAGASGRIVVGSGTLILDGSYNDLTSQALSGGGTLTLGNQSYSLIGASTTVTTANLTLGDAATLKLVSDLSYTGNFSAGNQALLNLGSHNLTLSGPASLAPPWANMSVYGTGHLRLGGATTIGHLNLLEAAQIDNTGTVTQVANVGVGNWTNQAAGITNAAGATWSLQGDVVMAGDSAKASFTNDGLLIKAGGTGTSLIRPALVGSAGQHGAVEVASGTLEFAKAVSGPQTFHIDAAATLVFDAGTTADSTVSFDGAAAALRLGDAPDFHGSLAHFGNGNTIDLRGLTYTGQAASFVSAAPGSGTLSVSDGTHAAALNMLGNYGANNFHLASDQHGGTLIGFVG